MTPVLQMVDTLDAGGMERVAVNLANVLSRKRYTCSLCTTRRDGPLSALVAPDVHRLCLARKGRLDLGAIRRLGAFITAHGIQLIHAHGSSLFTAIAGSLYPPYPAIVWHDHYGLGKGGRSVSVYRLAARRVSAVVSVNETLAEWARHSLRLSADRVRYLPNFVCESQPRRALAMLPGRRGARIVCVAAMRPQKNHLDLIRAFAEVRAHRPDAHLLLVGSGSDETYRRAVDRAIDEHDVGAHVSNLGYQEDVASLLRQCDVGVLASVSEGFPLALVEYGLAGLPVVATDVGQCAEILAHGRAGLLVPARDPSRLAHAILSVLDSPELRSRLGDSLKEHVEGHYSQDAILSTLYDIYETVTLPTHPRAAVARAAS